MGDMCSLGPCDWDSGSGAAPGWNHCYRDAPSVVLGSRLLCPGGESLPNLVVKGVRASPSSAWGGGWDASTHLCATSPPICLPVSSFLCFFSLWPGGLATRCHCDSQGTCGIEEWFGQRRVLLAQVCHEFGSVALPVGSSESQLPCSG